VLVQCKRLQGRHAKIGPHLVRELDGALRGARSAALFDMLSPRQADTVQTDEQEQQHISSTGPAIGVLVSTKPATKGVVDSMRRSSRGLVWVMMEEISKSSAEESVDAAEDEVTDEEQLSTSSDEAELDEPQSPSGDFDEPLLQGRVKQVLWNQAARDAGLEGIDVTKRYDGNGREEIVLMRGGRVWGGS
jgi:hypothetical protein